MKPQLLGFHDIPLWLIVACYTVKRSWQQDVCCCKSTTHFSRLTYLSDCWTWAASLNVFHSLYKCRLTHETTYLLWIEARFWRYIRYGMSPSGKRLQNRTLKTISRLLKLETFTLLAWQDRHYQSIPSVHVFRILKSSFQIVPQGTTVKHQIQL